MSGSRDALEQGCRRTSLDQQVEDKENDAQSREKTTADLGVAIRSGRGEQNNSGQNEGGDKADREKLERVVGGDGEGFVETATDFPEVVHVSRSFVLASLLTLVLGVAVVVCGPGMALLAGGAFMQWMVLLTIFYVVFRFWGNGLGVAMDTTQALLALLVTALALLLSGNAVAGLLTAGFALGLCGAAAGIWLAVLAARTGMTFRQSLAAVFDLKGRRLRSLA